MNREASTFWLKLLVMSVVIASGVALVLFGGVVASVAGTVLIGSMMAHALELQHECIHGTAFKSRRANEFVGTLLGLPTLVSFAAYKQRHLRHHRHLGTSRDEEFFNYPTSHDLTWKNMASSGFGFSHYRTVIRGLSALREAGSFSSHAHVDRRIRVDYLMIAAMILTTAALSVGLRTPAPALLWLASLVIVAMPIHYLIELPEHLFCSRSSPSVFHNTRTIRGSFFSKWFTNFNNLHVEHHHSPSLPFRGLPQLSQSLAVHCRHSSATYPEFYRKVISRLAEGAVWSEAEANAVEFGGGFYESGH